VNKGVPPQKAAISVPIPSNLIARDNSSDHLDSFKNRVFYYGVPTNEEEYGSDDSEDSGSDHADEESDSDGFHSSDDPDYEATPEIENSTPSSSALLQPESTTKRGIEIRLPDIVVSFVALVKCVKLSLSIECSRCKTSVDVISLASNEKRDISCTKCSQSMSIMYRSEMLVPLLPSRALGYLDLIGCHVLDMLPSAMEALCDCGQTVRPVGMFKSLPRAVEAIGSCFECNQRILVKCKGL
jgi:DNA-directed RNA polymerase subunit RPC12/RpoP